MPNPEVIAFFSDLRELIKTFPVRGGNKAHQIQNLQNQHPVLPSELRSFLTQVIYANPGNPKRAAYLASTKGQETKRKWHAHLSDRFCPCGTQLLSSELLKLPGRQFCSDRCKWDNPELNDKKTLARSARLQLERGVSNISQLPEVKLKKIVTSQAKYGVEHSIIAPHIQKKIEATNMAKLGCETPFHSPRVQEKIIDTWRCQGISNPMQSETVKAKLRASNLVRYGEEHPMKNARVAKRCFASGIRLKQAEVGGKVFKGLMGYEPQALRHLVLVEGVPVAKIKAGSGEVAGFDYVVRGQIRRYWPDLYIDGKTGTYIEVKSTYTATVDKETIKAKLKSVRDSGFNVRLMVVTEKGDLVLSRTWKA